VAGDGWISAHGRSVTLEGQARKAQEASNALSSDHLSLELMRRTLLLSRGGRMPS
jgi:hypothetical protein